MLLWISGSLTVIVFTSLEFICGVGLMEARGCCKWSVHIAKPRNNSLFLSAQCWQEWQLLQVPLEKAESAVHTSLIASHLHYLHLETVWRVEKCPVTALVGLVSTETNWQHVPSDWYIAPTTDISKRPFSPRRLPENVQLNFPDILLFSCVISVSARLRANSLYDAGSKLRHLQASSKHPKGLRRKRKTQKCEMETATGLSGAVN